MTTPATIEFLPARGTDLEAVEGTLVVFAAADGVLGPAASEIDEAMGGALTRAVGDDFKGKPGTARSISYPGGMAAKRVILAAIGDDPDRTAARKTGSAIAKVLAKGDVTLCPAGLADDKLVAEMLWAMILRLYDFNDFKTDDEAKDNARAVAVVTPRLAGLQKAFAPFRALAEGVFFTRDLVNKPANVLTTNSFAKELKALEKLGVEVEVLGERELKKLGARALLAVGQGSASESKIVVMKWIGSKRKQAPLALVGKGVVFDTGGISLKPAGGMEDMTMDMGGAGVVSGVMKTLALRQAKANVIGVVGLVENMPGGKAQRPGDIVESMKGDTVEVINTDAEGRLVLCDALWYTQQEFEPQGVIDLATLTGAMVIALGHHRAGYFSNDDKLAGQFGEAADLVGDDAWRMPLGKPYADQLKSRLADLKNVGGRPAGSITAAEFLHRFIQDGMPWIHIDIAGVASVSSATELAPKGATGWGVAALDQLVRTRMER
ncbi:MAG: leucyl aminopeptidase [Paracoccaceae bacterium]|nr:leucyl aminopeptidase [Paracoccaceae bacterium]